MNRNPNLTFKLSTPTISEHTHIDMGSATTAPPQHQSAGLVRSIAKLMRLRHAATGKRRPEDNAKLTVDEEDPDGAKQARHKQETMKALLALTFAGVSSFKASYAQLQLAQSPYDSCTVQDADHSIVAELQRLSQLKHLYFTKQLETHNQFIHRETIILSQIQELKSLVKTFQITTKKLELDLKSKDSLIHSLKQQLRRGIKENKSLSTTLRTHISPKLAQLNPTHFISTLQHTMKSIRSFVDLLMCQLHRANWDLAGAAAAIEPPVPARHRALVFEAFVCRILFEGFHLGDAGDRAAAYREHLELKTKPLEELLGLGPGSPFGWFCKVKYEALVLPTMEEAMFGDLEQRRLLGFGDVYPSSSFFMCFAEMARRVWVLRILFWSFDKVGVFVAARGSRYSEVYMTSEAAEDDSEAEEVVGFTVVPGFRVGGVVVQSRVYLERRDGRL